MYYLQRRAKEAQPVDDEERIAAMLYSSHTDDSGHYNHTKRTSDTHVEQSSRKEMPVVADVVKLTVNGDGSDDFYKETDHVSFKNIKVGVGTMSQLSIVALFLEMDYLRILKIAPDIK